MTAGQTSATDNVALGIAVHSCELVENHVILAQVSYETGAGQWEAIEREVVRAECEADMNAWCEAHQLSPLSIHQIEQRRLTDGAEFVGISWTVTIGKGTGITADDPIEAGEWTFSSRAGHWWRFLNLIRGHGIASGPGIIKHQGKPLRHLASVTELPTVAMARQRTIAEHQARVVEHQARVEAAARQATGRLPVDTITTHADSDPNGYTMTKADCTCPLGGPWPGPCPVHFTADS